MQGVDIVIHTAAASPLYSPADIYSTDIDGLRNVLQSALEHGVSRVVHISSTAVYGIPDHHPLLETDRLDGVGPYGISKVQAEEICQQFRDQGPRIPIIRPTCRAGAFRCLCAFLRLGQGWQELPRPGSGANRYDAMSKTFATLFIWRRPSHARP